MKKKQIYADLIDPKIRNSFPICSEFHTLFKRDYRIQILLEKGNLFQTKSENNEITFTVRKTHSVGVY